MPAVRFPIRPWLYLAAAAVLLAVPLARYTDTPEQLAFVAFGTLLVTLAAHVDVLGAVRRSRLPQMRGQPELLRLSMFRISQAERDVWRGLWRSGRWTVVAALILARFALALALAHYLYLYFVRVPSLPVIGDGVSAILRAVNYISHNESNYPPFRPDFVFLDAAVWQKVLALALIATLTVAETRFVMMLGLLLCTGPRWLQRHLAGAAGLVRLALAGLGLIASATVGNMTWLPPQVGPDTQPYCAASRSVASAVYGAYYAGYWRPCAGLDFTKVMNAAKESAVLAILSPLDAGTLASATVMRPTKAGSPDGLSSAFEARFEFTYGSYGRLGRPTAPQAGTSFHLGWGWYVLRVSAANLLPALLLGISGSLIGKSASRRLYRPVP